MVFRILFVLLAAGFAVGALGTVRGTRPFAETMRTVGVGEPLATGIAALELTAVAGLVYGLHRPAAGVAAAIGLAMLMCGAIGFHVRVRDLRGAATPALFGTVAGLAAALAVAEI